MVCDFIEWVEDQILMFLQRRCHHPGGMVSADVLEGQGMGVEVKYCNRCGSIKSDYRNAFTIPRWRLPDPNLWRK